MTSKIRSRGDSDLGDSRRATAEPADSAGDVGELLALAWDPPPLNPKAHDTLLHRALQDPSAPASEQERREARRLRDALSGQGEHADADLAQAIQLAAGVPAPKRSNALRPAEVQSRLARPAAPNVVYVVFGAVGLAAAAAALLGLFLHTVDDAPVALDAPEPVPLLESRSTTTLFKDKFVVGRTSERMDRIALARDRDLRNNRFTLWGVR